MDRRLFLQLSGLLFVCPNIVMAGNRAVKKFNLNVNYSQQKYLNDTIINPMYYNAGFPVIVVNKGERIQVAVHNQLNQQTTVHWHGIRLPSNMDGVPWLSQKPIEPNQRFTYEFDCVDAGTYWFHTHINSKQQMSRGMVGMLIVNDETAKKYTDDVVWAYHDLNLTDDGLFADDSYGDMKNFHNAMMAGTVGNFPTVNGKPINTVEQNLTGGGVSRIRILNTDSTRVLRLQLFKDKKVFNDAQIIALDGNPLAQPMPVDSVEIAPGMRMDIAMKNGSGGTIYLGNINYRRPYIIGRLNVPQNNKSQLEYPDLPKSNPIAKIDLSNAVKKDFIFTSKMSMMNRENPKFWKINSKSWSGENSANLPEPLQKLKRGQTYIFNIRNTTAFDHPIHIHGHTWQILNSSQHTKRKNHFSDTVLIKKDETMTVGFVADNVGDWMLHCHVVDHMETGMMGYVSVR